MISEKLLPIIAMVVMLIVMLSLCLGLPLQNRAYVDIAPSHLSMTMIDPILSENLLNHLIHQVNGLDQIFEINAIFDALERGVSSIEDYSTIKIISLLALMTSYSIEKKEHGKILADESVGLCSNDLGTREWNDITTLYYKAGVNYVQTCSCWNWDTGCFIISSTLLNQTF